MMQVVRHLSDIVLPRGQRTVLTIGSYDGIHQGHRHIIKKLKKTAESQKLLSALIAFHPRPATIFAPQLQSDYLTTLAEKLTIFQELGLDIVAMVPFSLEFAQTPPHRFVEQIFQYLHPVELWAGKDFRFGKDRQGDVVFLQQVGQALGFKVNSVDLQRANDERISSTQIRTLLMSSDIRQVSNLLGDYPFLQGVVVKGMQRGRTIGVPTANIAVEPDKLLPANGVYAAWVQVANVVYPAVANIGIRPTFDEGIKTIEAHIFDFDQTIYGQTVRVDWVDYIRPEKTFAGIDALVEQIRIDAQRAKSILMAETKPVRPPLVDFVKTLSTATKG